MKKDRKRKRYKNRQKKEQNMQQKEEEKTKQKEEENEEQKTEQNDNTDATALKEPQVEESEEAEKEPQAEESEEAEKEPQAEESEEAEEDSKAKESEEAEKEPQAEESEEPEKESKAEESEEPEKEPEKSDAGSETLATAEAVPAPYIDSSVQKYKERKKVGRYLLFAAAAVFLLAYIGGVVYYSIFFRQKTYINGYDVSGMKVQEAEAIFQREIDTYTLEITFKNGSESIKTGDGGLRYDLSKSVQQIKKTQNPFLWFTCIGKEDRFTVEYLVSYDEEALKNIVYSYEYMKDENMKPSTNARVLMQDGEVTVIPDQTGTELDKEKVFDEIKLALKAFLTTLSIEEKECYIPADILADSEQISAGEQAAKDFLALQAEYDFNGYKVSITPNELCKMAYVDANGELKISETGVDAFVKQFSERYSTCKTDRKFTTHDGRHIEVYGGRYGWQIDPEAEAEELYLYLAAGRDFTKEPVCEKKGYTYSAENDIGKTYVEVDLSDQHVYLYKDGKQVFDTPCVSGNMSLGRGTPGGLYGITYKARNVVLRGEDYESPVSYWMPFNGGIGLHDATWRGSFGGSIYWSNGSHGCVNLPYSAAATIFGYVEEGMPVVCYWD